MKNFDCLTLSNAVEEKKIKEVCFLRLLPMLFLLFSHTYCVVTEKNKSVSLKKHSMSRRVGRDGDSLWRSLKNFIPKKKRNFLVIIPSYNNKDWYKNNLDSVFMQRYPFYKVVYIDDCSIDGTGYLVETYVKEKKQEGRFIVIKNKERMFALANIYASIHTYGADDDIAVVLDGDDWWAHDHVLTLLNKVYDKFDAWMTYGQYKTYPSGKIGLSRNVPDRVIKTNSFRDYTWVTSQQRTFYVWLFKLIKKDDLLYKGEFLKKSGDVGVMFPLLEMAGRKSKFVQDVIYIYNRANPINNSKVYPGFSMSDFVRKKERYKPLEKRPV